MRGQRPTLIAAVLVTALAMAACGSSGESRKPQYSPGFGECDGKPNVCNSGPTAKGGTLTIAIEKKIPNWNTFDTDGNTYEAAQVLGGVLPAPFVFEPDSTVRWNPDLLAGEPKVTTTDPMTVVYRLRREAVWSDGTPISARDFEYFWRSNNGKDCRKCTPAATAGYDVISSVAGTDDGRTVTVTFASPYPDWRSLFTLLYPAHIAARAGDLGTPDGLAAAFEAFKEQVPTWSGGAYRIAEQQKNVSVTLVPNEKWYGDPAPALDKITFRVIEDQPQQIPALRNREVDALISQPNQDMVNAVRGMAGVNYHLAKGPSWEHIDLNVTNRFLRDQALRRAIFTAIDRKSIIDKTVGTFFAGAAPLGSHNLMPGMPDYRDIVGPTGQGGGDAARARGILSDAGYRIEGGRLLTRDGEQVAPLRFRFTAGNTLRQQTGELVQAHLREIGVTVALEPTDDLGETLSKGDFDIALFAWIGTPFLSDKKDLWTTNAGGNYGHWSNPEADRLIDEAVRTLDATKARGLFNRADEIMTAEAYNLPLFQKPIFLAIYTDYVNVRNNPTSSGPAYNIDEWGRKA